MPRDLMILSRESKDQGIAFVSSTGLLTNFSVSTLCRFGCLTGLGGVTRVELDRTQVNSGEVARTRVNFLTMETVAERL